MSSLKNRAAWLVSKQKRPLKVDTAPMPALPPAPHSIVIRVHAVAMNPVDYGIQALGMLVESYPAILGCDAAGEVIAVGSEVQACKVGDRVTGCADVLHGHGCFQEYATIEENVLAKIPQDKGIEYKDAVVLPLALSTAATGMFQQNGLALPFPKVDVESKKDQVLFIWSGSSSVGSCAIQLGKAAGLEVAATASAHNLEYMKSIGADYVFDRADEAVVEKVVTTLKGKQFMGAYDSVFPNDGIEKCGEIAHQLGGKQLVCTVLAPGMPMDAKLPEGVNWCYSYGDELKNNEVGPAVWGDWVTPALANGALKCKPDAHVSGSGLESVQDALDLMGKGASAQKFVVEIA